MFASFAYIVNTRRKKPYVEYRPERSTRKIHQTLFNIIMSYENHTNIDSVKGIRQGGR